MKNHPIVNQSAGSHDGKLLPLSWFEAIFCYISLGLICGCVQICLVFLIICGVLSFRGWTVAQVSLAVYIILTIHPMSDKPQRWFYNSWMFDLWQKYFAYSWVNYSKLEKGKKYLFLEMPHGIFPMGQFVSTSTIKDVYGDHETIVGLGADVIFYFPLIRHLMKWSGTRPASRKNITKIFDVGHHCAILPGGIAEMYLCDNEVENVYLQKRKGCIKAALQEGANVIPIYFYGNSHIFDTYNSAGTSSFVSRISRRLQASIVFFTGRQYLPVPFRHPLKMVLGPVIEVPSAIPNPTDEEIDDLHEKVIAMVKLLYAENRPSWETNDLVIH